MNRSIPSLDFVRPKSWTRFRFSVLWLVLMIPSLVMVIPSAYGLAFTINASSSYMEDNQATVYAIIQDETPFSGTVSLQSTNLQLGSSSISVTSAGFSGSHFNSSFAITGLDPGAYSLYANLSNSSTGATIAVINITGTINSSAPRIVSSSPSGIVSKDSTIIQLVTDESATCRFAATNATYDSMTQFANTESTRHNHSLTSLSEGAYAYYVRCKDSGSYVMNVSELIQFTVDLPPSAAITLSDSTPVKAGTIEVTLTLSESVPSAPILQYGFDDSTAKKSISLTGSGKNWKGYIIITESENNKIGAFAMSATDSSSNTGTSITSGNIFVVDTSKPPAPSGIKPTILSNGDIQLDWYYDGEEVDEYRIYRTISSGVGFVDYHDEVSVENSSLRYKDASALDQVTYYYRVSAVDGAGNEGPLSEEVYATSISASTSSSSSAQSESSSDPEVVEDIPRVLPPNLIYHVNDQMKKVDKALLDIDTALSSLSASEEKKKKQLDEFGILSDLQSAKTSLASIKAGASELKNHYHTEADLLAKLAQFELDQRKIELTTPKDAELKEEAQHIQSTSNEDIQNAANYVLSASGLTEKEAKQYLKLNLKNKDRISVTSSIKVVEFTYLDGSSKQKTFIKKSIVADVQNSLQDVVLMEFIPKTVAASVGEITFQTPNYEVVEEDPVVKFGFLNFNSQGEQISYEVGKAVSLEEAKMAKSVMLLSLNELADPSNSLTGFSIFGLGGFKGANTPFVWIGVILIAGLLGYYLLFLNGYQDLSRTAMRKMNLYRLKRDVSSYGGKFDSSAFDAQSTKHLPRKLPISESEAQLLLHELYSHVDSAKQNMADQLLPALFSLHSKIAQKKEASDGEALSVQELIHLANFHAKMGDSLKAMQFYRRINSLYSSLPKERKGEVYAECMKLHELLKEVAKV